MKAILKKSTLLKVVICFLSIMLISNGGFSFAQDPISEVTDIESSQYPALRKEKHTDTIFGEVIEDDYRWLENSANPQIKEWIDAQNKFTDKALRKPSNKINSYVIKNKYSYVK